MNNFIRFVGIEMAIVNAQIGGRCVRGRFLVLDSTERVGGGKSVVYAAVRHSCIGIRCCIGGGTLGLVPVQQVVVAVVLLAGGPGRHGVVNVLRIIVLLCKSLLVVKLLLVAQLVYFNGVLLQQLRLLLLLLLHLMLLTCLPVWFTKKWLFQCVRELFCSRFLQNNKWKFILLIFKFFEIFYEI